MEWVRTMSTRSWKKLRSKIPSAYLPRVRLIPMFGLA
jgi:hypothetical protein